jgi:hypothetical protein
MRDQYIFDIPVYRSTQDSFDAEIQQEFEERKNVLASYGAPGRPLSREVTGRELGLITERFGGPWQFNQIVGWLRIFGEGRTIGAHLWWIEGKRINRRSPHKRLLLMTASDVLGLWLSNESSSEILGMLLERISELAETRPYRGRYIDLEVLRRLGPFIDWRALVDRPD